MWLKAREHILAFMCLFCLDTGNEQQSGVRMIKHKHITEPQAGSGVRAVEGSVQPVSVLIQTAHFLSWRRNEHKHWSLPGRRFLDVLLLGAKFLILNDCFFQNSVTTKY